MKSLHYFSAILVAMLLWACSMQKKASEKQTKTSAVSMPKSSFVVEQPKMPLLTEKENLLAKISFTTESKYSFNEIRIKLKSTLKDLDLSEILVYVSKENLF